RPRDRFPAQLLARRQTARQRQRLGGCRPPRPRGGPPLGSPQRRTHPHPAEPPPGGFRRPAQPGRAAGRPRRQRRPPPRGRGGRVDGEVTLWDLRTGRALWTRGGHTGAVGSLAFAADGKTLASAGSVFDGRVKLWDVATGTDLGALGLKAEVANVVGFDPSGV